MNSLLVSLLLAGVLAFIPARIAAAKGRSFRLWWLYGWMFWIIALIHSLLLRPLPAPAAAGFAADQDVTRRRPLRPCPQCGEAIRVDTPMCAFCGAIMMV